MLSTLADKDTMRALESTIKEAASSHSVEDLRSQVLRQSAEVGELMATLQERIGEKARLGLRLRARARVRVRVLGFTGFTGCTGIH